jgi:hypothetical protein
LLTASMVAIFSWRNPFFCLLHSHNYTRID